MLPEINRLIKTYSPRGVQFVLVYILEAHAKDEWPIRELPREMEPTQHKTIEDRIACARLLKSAVALDSSVQILVDNESDLFVHRYCSWPFRYWVLSEGVVRDKMMPEGDKFSLSSLKQWLEINIQTG